jgi:hypothetical protein
MCETPGSIAVRVKPSTTKEQLNVALGCFSNVFCLTIFEGGTGKMGVVRVPVGSEDEWVRRLPSEIDCIESAWRVRGSINTATLPQPATRGTSER